MPSEQTLANLQKFLTLLNASLNLQAMLTAVAQQLVEMFAVDHSGVLFFGEQDLAGEVIAEYPAQGAVGFNVPLTDYPLVDQLKAQQRPISVLDAQSDPLMGNARPTMQILGIQSIVIIPLVVQNKIVGSLSLDSISQPRAFTPDELALCHIIGNQIAVAVDYTRALEAAEASRRQAQTLGEVTRVLNESLKLAEILPVILNQLKKVVPADGGSIHLLVETGVQTVACTGDYHPFELQKITSLETLWGARELIRQKTPLVINDTHTHPHWEVHPDSPVRSWLGLPLLVQDEVVGLLFIDGYAPDRFKAMHVQLAQIFAAQAAIAIHNARLYGQAEKRAELMTLMQQIGLDIVVSLDLSRVLRTVADAVLTLTEASQSRLYLYEAQTDTFTLLARLDGSDRIQMQISQPRKEGLTASVAHTGQYMAIPNVIEHPLYRDEADMHGFKAIIGVPMKKGAEVLGVLNVFYEQPHSFFTAEELDLLHLLATQAAVALENARLYGLEQERLQAEARRTEQWRRVQEISSTLNASLDLDTILHTACEQFIRLIEVDHCGILLFAADGLTGQVVAEFPPRGAVGAIVPLTYPAIQQMRRDWQPIASTDAANDPAMGEARQGIAALGIKSMLIAPLVAQGQVIGSIGLDTLNLTRQFTPEEINLCRVVADQMAIAITNARTYQAERAARIQADTLREAAAIVSESLELKIVLERILAQLARVIHYDSSSIILHEKERFRVVAGHAQPPATQTTLTARPHLQEIVRTQRPLVIPDTALFEGWPADNLNGVGSWIGAPLLVSERLIGLLELNHPQPNFYRPADGDLITAFAHLAAIALENARLYEFEVKQIEQELNIARQIQRGFLPREIPTLPGWEIAAICQPARETGGDFYDFVKLPDDSLGLIVGDVSGKSIPAAMLMAAAQSVIGAKASDHRSPARVMRETNRLLVDDVPKGSFVAAAYALLSAQDKTVCLSNCGQLAPLLVPANGQQPVRLVESPGDHLPLGIVPNPNYQEMTLSLAPGDTLVFHTDGLVERKDKADQLFGFERLMEILEQQRGQPAQAVLEALLRAADTFANGVGPADDVTLVVVRRISELPQGQNGGG